MSRCLTLIGTTGIQDYVFASNKLRENSGASELVRWALDEGLLAALRRCMDERKELIPVDDSARRSATAASRGVFGLDVESRAHIVPLFIGGGNAAVLFSSRELALQGLQNFTADLLASAPELRIVAVHALMRDSFRKTYERALADLVKAENASRFGASLMALPVVRTCSSTGLAAVCRDEVDGAYLSAASRAKRLKEPQVRDRFARDFGRFLNRGNAPQRFPGEFDDLGGKSGENHIAIVHADGNGIGKVLSSILRDASLDNDALLDRIRKFSTDLETQASLAFCDVLDQLAAFLQTAEARDQLALCPGLFPLRPIVYGGDDLTFVCDGRLGLSLASSYLKSFAGRSLDVGGARIPLNACAGVAIIPTRFPFARGYAIAEELCNSAKRKRAAHARSACGDDSPAESWLDYQLVVEGFTGTVQEARDRLYRSREGHLLTSRPVAVGATVGTVPRLEDMEGTLLEFRTQWPRSRCKALLKALTLGREETGAVLAAYRSRSWNPPEVPGQGAARTTGWIAETTPYFDPLELLDYYLQVPALPRPRAVAP